MKDSTLKKGIVIMLSSSCLTSVGQLCWKISSIRYPCFCLPAGFALYGLGALLMILALRYGNLSILHPMLSAGYALSVILGSIVLHEPITITKILGIAMIFVGLLWISAPEGVKKR